MDLERVLAYCQRVANDETEALDARILAAWVHIANETNRKVDHLVTLVDDLTAQVTALQSSVGQLTTAVQGDLAYQADLLGRLTNANNDPALQPIIDQLGNINASVAASVASLQAAAAPSTQPAPAPDPTNPVPASNSPTAGSSAPLGVFDTSGMPSTSALPTSVGDVGSGQEGASEALENNSGPDTGTASEATA